jgi:hypothetical protein
MNSMLTMPTNIAGQLVADRRVRFETDAARRRTRRLFTRTPAHDVSTYEPAATPFARGANVILAASAARRAEAVDCAEAPTVRSVA